jgi:CheY-like chemotaxis protein
MRWTEKKNNHERREMAERNITLRSKGGNELSIKEIVTERPGGDEAATPLRVLLAEDNPGDVQLMSLLFDLSGLTVSLEHVTDGEKALSYLRHKGDPDLPDVILLDLRMPRMDGFDFLKERMKDVRLSSVPTVVLTSSNAPRDRRMAMELGADLFILKPDRMDEAEELVPCLERFIKERTEPRPGEGYL